MRDAATNLKTLKLTGCVNITGSGLQILRVSTVIEQIDLSLVGQHESPSIEREPMISEDIAIPILESIMEHDNSSLRHLQLPKLWRIRRSVLLSQFLSRYDQFLERKVTSCSNCQSQVHFRRPRGSNGHFVSLEPNTSDYGLQCFTCYKCTRYLL